MNDSGTTTSHTDSAQAFGPDPGRQARIQQLEDRITELTAHIDAATYRWLELVREYDQSGAWAGPGLKSCAHWLNWKCGLAIGTARERVRVAHALAKLPGISAALREGRISYSKVRAMTRAATSRNEGELLHTALNGTATHVERVVRHLRRAERSEALEQENRRHELRELNWFIDDDGSLVLKGRFTPKQGAVIRQALEAVLEDQHEERKNVPAGIAEHEQPDPLRSQPQPIAARRADALVRIAEGWLVGSPQGNSGDRFLVNVHTDLDTLQADGCGAEAELEENGNVSAETARRLSCDAAVIQWLEAADGEPLSVGRKTRSIPPAIRRALQRRDGGCRFPGCTATRFVDAHHIRHWADGGETNMPNLTLLCRHHHCLVHEGGFGLRSCETAGLNLHSCCYITPFSHPTCASPATMR